ncbi:hypothetical protein [Streptomyces griseoflavus]|uniref:hypothetical protein n=1 Tax=Streptomyces griseoflavus TaxID=35619 RepID=UPI003D745A04
MTRSPALPGAAPRTLRGAAGRRAVRLALLVGAVFVLGVLCGERARAADDTPDAGTSAVVEARAASGPGASTGSGGPTGPDGGTPPTAPTGSAAPTVLAGSAAPTALAAPAGSAAPTAPTAPTGSTGPSGSPSPAASPGPRVPSLSAAPGVVVGALTASRPDEAGRPLTETVVRSVGRRTVRPAGDLVGEVAGDLGRAAAELTATVGKLPVPHRPAPLPGIPPLPGPSAPALPGSPGTGPPNTRQPTSPPPGDSAPDVPDTPGIPGARSGPAVAAHPATHSPRSTDGFTDGHGAPYDSGRDGREAQRAERDGTRAPGTGPALLAPHAPPGGMPDGVLGGRSSADQGTQRHGDAGAVPAIHHRPATGLVPGATARAEASATRDRCRDVPVPPA